MHILHSVSVLNATPDETKRLELLAPACVITKVGDWTRATWVRELYMIEPVKPESVKKVLSTTSELRAKLVKDFAATHLKNADMVTLYTQIGEIHDFRVISR